jgi:hypothetical protein
MIQPKSSILVLVVIYHYHAYFSMLFSIIHEKSKLPQVKNLICIRESIKIENELIITFEAYNHQTNFFRWLEKGHGLNIVIDRNIMETILI